MKNFEPTLESLRNYRCPDWYRDAKFGIYCHWGPQCVPRAGDWYARNMYIQGHRQYRVHLKKYGHPSVVGYKDVIPQWKAENFDPDAIIGFFKKIGAKFTGPVAVHHDNFDLWDSKHHPRWNAANIGPEKDIVKLWKESAEKHGLHFGCTTHLSRTYSWFQTCHHSDKIGPKKGVPYDGETSGNEDLYLEKSEDDNRKAPLNPPKKWREHWKNRMFDLIDNYHPKFFYFDAAVPFAGDDNGKTGMEVIAHFYNDNLEQTNGKSNGFLTIKQIKDHGPFYEGISSVDWERKYLKKPAPVPWQTDDSVGDWFYDQGDRYKTPKKIIDILINVVSMNGCLMLNVPLMPDGTMDDECRSILSKVGEWLQVNGESIYGTRPWHIAAEGKVFFTTKDDIIYVFISKRVLFGHKIKALGENNYGKKIERITNISKNIPVDFTQDGNKLKLRLDRTDYDEIYTVLKIM